MKIKIADIEPNPFRDFDNYPIDRERVEGLKDSIYKDTFWGGIPVRPHPTKKGKYQMGCGHHRLVAFRENGIKEIEVPIVTFSDAQMLRIMINENAEYQPRPKLINSDVEKAKKFLDELLNKYKTWETAKCDIDITLIFKNSQGFGKAKKTLAGRRTILDYLGKPWAKRGWMIQAALAILKESKTYLNREAVETIPTVDQANVFRCAVKNHDIPKKTQKKIAEKIKKEKIGSKGIPDLVAEHSLKPAKKPEPKSVPMLDDYVNEIIKLMSELYDKLHHIKKNVKNIRLSSIRNELGLSAKELIEQLGKIEKELDYEKKEKKAVDSVSS